MKQLQPLNSICRATPPAKADKCLCLWFFLPLCFHRERAGKHIDILLAAEGWPDGMLCAAGGAGLLQVECWESQAQQLRAVRWIWVIIHDLTVIRDERRLMKGPRRDTEKNYTLSKARAVPEHLDFTTEIHGWIIQHLKKCFSHSVTSPHILSVISKTLTKHCFLGSWGSCPDSSPLKYQHSELLPGYRRRFGPIS